MAYNFAKDEESKHRRQEIMQIIKQLTESEWNNYVQSPNKKLDYKSYIKEKFGISPSTLASVIECGAGRMKHDIIKKCYRIYAISDKADKKYFASIFQNSEDVMTLLQDLSESSEMASDAECENTNENPEMTLDVEDESTNEGFEMTSDEKDESANENPEISLDIKAENENTDLEVTSDIKVESTNESSEASLHVVDEKMKSYVKNAMSDSYNVELESDENTYKKYDITWKYGHSAISWFPIKYLYIVPVKGSNVKEIVEKKNRMKEDSLIWFIYPVKDEALQRDTERYIKKCKFPEDCVLMESTLGEKNVYILYNPQNYNVKSYMHSGIYLKEMPIIQVKEKKDGKRKKKSRKISFLM